MTRNTQFYKKKIPFMFKLRKISDIVTYFILLKNKLLNQVEIKWINLKITNFCNLLLRIKERFKMAVSVGDKEDVQSEPNVVPLCDVLLVLLIIFMVVTPFLHKGVDVRLPSALNTINMPDNPEVVLAIRKDGSIYVNNEQVTEENLQTMLEEAFLMVSEKKLYLRADQELEYGKIVDVIDIVKNAGLEIVGIITEKKTEVVE